MAYGWEMVVIGYSLPLVGTVWGEYVPALKVGEMVHISGVAS